MKTAFNEWRTWCTVRLLVTLTLVGTVFTACSDDEEANGTFSYQAGFDMVSNLDFLQTGSIENAYFEALNVTDGSFTLTGSEEECDAEVYRACKSAETEVEAMNLNGTFTYVVKNVTTSQEVYSYTYTPQTGNE